MYIADCDCEITDNSDQHSFSIECSLVGGKPYMHATQLTMADDSNSASRLIGQPEAGENESGARVWLHATE